MARWQITISGKGVRKSSVEALAEAMKEKFGDGASFYVKDDTPPESRSERYGLAQSMVSDGKMEMESLREELQDWKDNLPENLQDSDKASQLEDAISSLDDVINDCENAEGHDVDFPGMF